MKLLRELAINVSDLYENNKKITNKLFTMVYYIDTFLYMIATLENSNIK